MSTETGNQRTDKASRVIHAPPKTVYDAFVHPESFVSWLPPEGMKGQVYEFDARAGGTYHMALTYLEADYASAGKTSDNVDVVRGTFLELVPGERIDQSIKFESDDPAYAGEMTMTWLLTAVPEGTLVATICENVPPGIDQHAHESGMRSTLENLAAFVE